MTDDRQTENAASEGTGASPCSAWKWFGNAGHFCAARHCMFHLTTQVGEYLVSTVGEYRPPFSKTGEPEEIGLDRLFETMVFRVSGQCKCGCGLPTHDGQELECHGYAEAASATVGHVSVCAHFAQMPNDTAHLRAAKENANE